MKNRLPITNSADFNISSAKLWKVISEPENLNNTHPFCKSNEIISWGEGGRSDRLIYLNGLNYIRTFKTWDEGAGYTLEIGKEGGPQSFVIWEIEPLGEEISRLKITVYPYLLDWGPGLLTFLLHKIWVKPRLEKYLHSVISGFRYYIKEDKRVPRNHFGKHSWFSQY
jgi:hypothetical protein